MSYWKKWTLWTPLKLLYRQNLDTWLSSKDCLGFDPRKVSMLRVLQKEGFLQKLESDGFRFRNSRLVKITCKSDRIEFRELTVGPLERLGDDVEFSILYYTIQNPVSQITRNESRVSFQILAVEANKLLAMESGKVILLNTQGDDSHSTGFVLGSWNLMPWWLQFGYGKLGGCSPLPPKFKGCLSPSGSMAFISGPSETEPEKFSRIQSIFKLYDCKRRECIDECIDLGVKKVENMAFNPSSESLVTILASEGPPLILYDINSRRIVQQYPANIYVELPTIMPHILKYTNDGESMALFSHEEDMRIMCTFLVDSITLEVLGYVPITPDYIPQLISVEPEAEPYNDFVGHFFPLLMSDSAGIAFLMGSNIRDFSIEVYSCPPITRTLKRSCRRIIKQFWTKEDIPLLPLPKGLLEYLMK